MRHFALVLSVLLLLAATSSQAQAADPYQWVGATTVAFTGDWNGGGFVLMTTQCRAEFGSGARICKSAEIMDSNTLDLFAIPIPEPSASLSLPIGAMGLAGLSMMKRGA